MENSKHLVITNSKITASDNIGAIGISKDTNCNISINNSEISGQTAISNSGKVNISITGSKINGKITRSDASFKISFINDTLTNTGYDNASVKESAKSPTSVTYNKKVVTKPTSDKLIEINNMDGKDITEKLKSAINELKSTGGIIYIPVGSYTISDHIDVYAGIEIRGANPLPHHYSGSGLTKLKTKYSKKVLFTLYDNSGLNGLSIIYTEQNVTKYPYTILGKGSNIYIKNIALANSWKGIDLATNQCDNHYVEHIWGYAFEKGITVGGNSKNGYIGGCHLTSNALYNRKEGDILKYTFEHLTAFEVGNSKNEVLVNNFVYAPNIGYHISSGADNFTFIGAGADNCNNSSLYLTGKINGQVINQLLATYPKTARNDITMGMNPSSRSYIKSKDVSGSINIVNSMAWNNPSGMGYSLNGTAKIDIYGGILDASSSPIVENSNSTLSIYGVIFKPTVSPVFRINNGTTSLRLSGNICTDKACSKNIQNNVGINVSINENGIK